MTIQTDIAEIEIILRCNEEQHRLIREILDRIKANYGDGTQK